GVVVQAHGVAACRARIAKVAGGYHRTCPAPLQLIAVIRYRVLEFQAPLAGGGWGASCGRHSTADTHGELPIAGGGRENRDLDIPASDQRPHRNARVWRRLA